MKVLIDTNIIITREDDHVIPESLQELERSLKNQGHEILTHPASRVDVKRDGNEKRREITESKIGTYQELVFPHYPRPDDVGFRRHVPQTEDTNEQVDNALLYSVYEDRVDYLITEDSGIQDKARRLGIGDRVLSVHDGLENFRYEPNEVSTAPNVQNVVVGDLDVDDPIFDPVKREYEGFEEWFENYPDRDAYVNWMGDRLGAVLIIKQGETENIGVNPPLGAKPRLKISTLIVDEERRGSKAGELLIQISVREAIEHNLEEIYLTHFTNRPDHLVDLITDYGFMKASETELGEDLFIKRLSPGLGDDPDPLETAHRFYPSFYDGEQVDKFLIPIRPEYHGKLFNAYEKRQHKLPEYGGQFESEGNAIKKAYLTRSNIRKIEPGSILLFYRTQDEKEITSLGVCDNVHYEVTGLRSLQRAIGRRSVFDTHELSDWAQDPTTVILFWWHFDLPQPVEYRKLIDNDVLNGPPQSITEVDEAGYKYVKTEGEIDERFAVN